MTQKRPVVGRGQPEKRTSGFAGGSKRRATSSKAEVCETLR
jgi:hypothetical protein